MGHMPCPVGNTTRRVPMGMTYGAWECPVAHGMSLVSLVYALVSLVLALGALVLASVSLALA